MPVEPDVVKVNRLALKSEYCQLDLSVNLRLPASMIMPGEVWTRARNLQI